MSDEIDEFIRRAAERRKQQGQGQGQRRAAQRSAAPAPPAPPPAARERTRPRLVEAEVLEAEVIEDVATGVSKHLDTREFDQRASQFGEQPGLADDRVEARLHQTFDHQLGRLAQTTTAAAPTPSTMRSATDQAASVTKAAANESLLFLVSALSSPQNLRQAVILSEILVRPEHRW